MREKFSCFGGKESGICCELDKKIQKAIKVLNVPDIIHEIKQDSLHKLTHFPGSCGGESSDG